jgi:flagellar biosynthesis protein FlhG
MQKTSEWLLSFNSHYQNHINSLVSQRKSNTNRTVTVSITGGKGGVGKTSVSLKFAKELARLGHRCLLIDCDYNLANTAIKLGLPIQNTFFDLVTAQKSFVDCLHRDGNFHLLSACNGSLELFDSKLKLEEIIIDIITAHENDYDFILLDCPAGLSREALTLNAYCDQRILVVTPDKSSITDSYSLVKVLNAKFGVKENHLLVNMYKTQSQYEKVVQVMSETIENFLNVRTQILGGVAKLDCIGNTFDTYFLEPAENSFHHNFLKIIKKYSDELSSTMNVLGNQSLKSEMWEQEVQ